MYEGENISTKMIDAEGSEEGEIVDSDEEQNMRQRIRELEAKNDELEKIASISGDFTNQYQYSTDYPALKNKLPNSNTGHILMSQKDVARIPSDASSISSEEMEPVRKRLRRKYRHSKYSKKRSRSNSLHKHHHHHHHRTHKSENKLIRTEDCCRKHKRKSNSPIVVINENFLETISLDTDEDSDNQKEDAASNSDYEGKDVSLYLNRDELRLALSRGRTKETKNSGNLLRERLYNGNVLLDHKENNTCELISDSLDPMKTTYKSHASEQSLENSDNVHVDECGATQEEQELRLIALKSAVLKKHLARKKRNAEMAYSPTDFAPVAANPNITDDNMDVVEEELNDMDDVMEISPINSPKLILSPSNEFDLNQSDLKTVGDNNSIDMDIAQSGSDEEFNNNNKRDQWCPIETVPITEQSIESNEALKYPLPIHYGIYVPEMQYQLAPPPNAIIEHSEAIDIEESIHSHGVNTFPNFEIDEKPPPPPSMYIEIYDDDDEPPLPPLPTNTLNMFSNMVFSDMNYHEEPPPPPPFFSVNENESTNNIFKRLGSKTEMDADNSPSSYSALNQHYMMMEKQTDLSDDENNDSDEEASALRAVLLSKLQTTKSQKRECTAKKVAEQLLPNLEIICHTEDNGDDKNEVETVLQKALRRLKSNYSSSSSLSPKENDTTRAVRVKDDATIMLEVVNSNVDIEENEELSTNTLPQPEKNTKPHNSISAVPSTQIIAKNFNEIQAKETDISAQPNETHDELITNSKTEKTELTNSNDLAKTSKSIVKNRTIDMKNIPKSENENRGVTLKQKQKQTVLPNTKNISTNENNKILINNLKRKRTNSVESSSTVTKRVQPLSVKNNLIPSVVSAPKKAQNLIPSTLNKVQRTTTTTRTTKIVRPNKVINKEITTNIKRALTPAGSPTPTLKIQQRTIPNTNTSAKSLNSTNSITDHVPQKITVKKLIINLRASDTETSHDDDNDDDDDELMKEVHVPVDSSIDRLKNTYNEISSPLELLMNSASCSPSRNRNSLHNESLSSKTSALPTTPVTNSAFEQKLDAFLKGIRKKGSLETVTSESPKCSPAKKSESAKNFKTPSAVRHLPLASQDEYRRLVYRMKLLEKQKQSKKTDEDVASEISSSSPKNIPVKNGRKQTEDNVDVDAQKTSTSNVKRNIQLKTLQSYENSFEQASDNIVRLLNKSLSLVAEAKKAKIAKLRHEQRLQELRTEIAKIQSLYEREERKFSCMKPHIGESNQFLTSLKKKRRNLMENANKLGRSLNGDKYRLNNKTGEEIISKSRQLHAEIKLVNAMKLENLENIMLHSKNRKETSADQSNVKTLLSESKNTQYSQVAQKKDSVVAVVETETQTAIPDTLEIDKSCVEQVVPLTDITTTTDEKLNDQAPAAVDIIEEEEESIVPVLETQTTVEHTLPDMESESFNEHSMETTIEKPKQQSPVLAEIVENQIQIEQEDQHDDDKTVEKDDDDDQSVASVSSNSVVPVYISPLDHFRHEYRNIDSNAMICPYEMWGKCADENCSYMHMTLKKRRGTELAFKPVNAEHH